MMTNAEAGDRIIHAERIHLGEGYLLLPGKDRWLPFVDNQRMQVLITGMTENRVKIPYPKRSLEQSLTGKEGEREDDSLPGDLVCAFSLRNSLAFSWGTRQNTSGGEASAIGNCGYAGDLPILESASHIQPQRSFRTFFPLIFFLPLQRKRNSFERRLVSLAFCSSISLSRHNGRSSSRN